MNDMTDLDRAYDMLGDAEGRLAEAQIYHMPTKFWEKRVMELKQAARELEAGYGDRYLGLVSRLAMLVNQQFAELTDVQIRTNVSGIEHQVDILNKYIQKICKHEQVNHLSIGSMWFNGDVMDDIDDKLICDICGKEVTNKDEEDLQGNEVAEF